MPTAADAEVQALDAARDLEVAVDVERGEPPIDSLVDVRDGESYRRFDCHGVADRPDSRTGSHCRNS
jgi:hypothetical protein